jgi:hypothetical protein
VNLTVIHLNEGDGNYSKRGVKLRDITSTERDDAYEAAARAAEGDNSRYLHLRVREGVVRMIVAVTEPGIKDVEALVALPKEKWMQLSAADMQGIGSEKTLDKLFTPKDMDILIGAFLRANEATGKELDAIMGKAIRVSE